MYCNDPLPPVDRRRTEIRHLNLPCEFIAPATKEAWEKRARELREHILVSMGLWPNPGKSPLNVEITDRIDRDDYSIENVRFQSMPGLYVTGNLYRPTRFSAPFPAVLNPHGHWEQGRLNHKPEGSIPARCINFARQGYVAFSWSMAGYNDSSQLSHRTFGDNRKLLWGLSLMGLQLWNSIRSVDFLVSLSDVDTDRIACTGASGGGTQTFMLAAVDNRVMAVAPVNMVSAHMQGGCICENGPNLRIETNNLEIAALAAPRPLLLVSATGDWTVNTPTQEYPAIRAIYSLYGAEDRLAEVQIDAEHNYNSVSREAVYAWFGRWVLGKGNDYHFSDQSVQVESPESMLAIKSEIKPDNWVNEDGLTSLWIDRARKQLDKMKPRDPKSLRKFRQIISAGFRSAIGSINTADDNLIVTRQWTEQIETCSVHSIVIGQKNPGSRIPITEFRPHGSPNGIVLVVHPGGLFDLTQENGRSPGTLIQHFLGKNLSVFVADVFLTGSMDGEIDLEKYNYYTTYNRTVAANRIQDIVAAANWVRWSSRFSSVALVGLGAAGPWCFLACGLCPQVARAVIDIDQFDTDSDLDYEEKLFLPVLRRLGGLPGAAALATPTELYLHNTGDTFEHEETKAAYRAADAIQRLRMQNSPADMAQMVAWIDQGSQG